MTNSTDFGVEARLIKIIVNALYEAEGAWNVDSDVAMGLAEFRSRLEKHYKQQKSQYPEYADIIEGA